MQPRSSKRIVLNTFGTHGDVLPFIGLAKQMQAMGHRPAVATSTHYADLIRSHGIEFLPAGPHHEQIGRDLGLDVAGIMKRAFDPITGGTFLLQKMILPYFEQSYEELDIACADADLLISQPMTAPAYLIAHKRSLPWKTVVLQPLPLGLMSAQDPSAVSNHIPLHKLQSLIGERAYRGLWNLIKKAGRPLVSVIDDKARQLGIYSKHQHPLFERVFSNQGTIALFPEALMRRPLATDWPPGVSFAGFSYFDGGQASLPDELNMFLERGERPVAFTLGSSVVMNPGRFFEESSLACEKLGVRAVFLAGPGTIERPLPKSQIVVPWASHAALFPRCRAVVNQGGIGTCAQALRAGVPQLVVPHAHDQPDNAYRLLRSGAALSLMPWKAHGRPLRNALFKLIDDAALRSSTRRMHSQINVQCGTITAAQTLLASDTQPLGYNREPLAAAA